jgi:hypothetical protein
MVEGGMLPDVPEKAPWARAARRAAEQAILHAQGRTGPEPLAEARAELGRRHARLANALLARGLGEPVAGLVEVGESWFELAPVPRPDARGGSRVRLEDPRAAAAVDWARSEVDLSSKLPRGAVVGRPKELGFLVDGEPVHRAVVRVSAGDPAALSAGARRVADAVARLPWSGLAAARVVEEASVLARDRDGSGEGFLEAGRRAARILDGWARALEPGIRLDPLTRGPEALVAMREVGRLASRLLGDPEDPPWLEDRVEDAAALGPRAEVRWVYREGTLRGEVVAILRLPGGDAGPSLVLSRGSAAPAWLERLREALEGTPAAAALQRAEEGAADLASREVRLGLAAEALRAARAPGREAEDLALRVERALAAMPDAADLAVVPSPRGVGSKEERLLLDELAATGAVFHVPSDGAPAGAVVHVLRHGLRDAAASPPWRVLPDLAVSAGPPGPAVREAAELALEARRALLHTPLCDGARRALRARFRTEVEERLRAPEAGTLSLLAPPGGLAEFASSLRPPSAPLLEGIVAAAARHGALAETPLRASCGSGLLAVLARREGDAVRVAALEGGASRPTPADLALGVLDALARHDEVDAEAKETRATCETLAALAGGASNAKAALCFLVTKVHALRRPLAPGAAAEALEDLARLADLLLGEAGLRVLPIAPGDDVRRFEGRYRPSAGSARWSVRAVLRPCLVEGERVVQVGIVDTA